MKPNNLNNLNEYLKEFLVSHREKANLSQSDVAARSEVFGIGRTLDQRAVSRIEKNPINADAVKIAGYLSAVGIPTNKYHEMLTKYTHSEDNLIMSKFNENTIKSTIEHTKELISSIKLSVENYNHKYIDSIEISKKINQLEVVIDGLNKKPIIGCFGGFDAGKSTLINTIINQALLPASYQPTTSIINLVMHESDKPKTISGNVAVFKKGFKPYMIHSDLDINEYLLKEGGIDILETLGIHNYESNSFHDAYMAIIFSDSEILRSVWLMDTPGDFNNSEDSDKALGSIEFADGIVFVSNQAGFLKDNDLGFASNIIRNRPSIDKNNPLGHLLFIQSHCHSEISKSDVDKVGVITFKRIEKQLNNLIFNSWLDDGFISELPNSINFIKRVQPFWRENKEYRIDTLNKISEMASFLTLNQESIIKQKISDINKTINDLMQNEIYILENKKVGSLNRINEINEKSAIFRKESTSLKEDFNSLIDSCESYKKQDLMLMKKIYENNTSSEGLEKIIREIFDNKKDAEAGIGNYIGQFLSIKLESTLKSSSKEISAKLDNLISRWQCFIPKISVPINNEISGLGEISGFNSQAAFIGGIAGLGSLGAMALYVSTIASNLGAYILVGNVAGWLVSLGVISNVTVLTSFVAAIGGPITIGIALALGLGYMIYRLFGGSWESSLADKVAEAIQKKQFFNNIENIIKKYWDDTAKGMKLGLNELIDKSNVYIDGLEADAKISYDEKEIDNAISLLKETINIQYPSSNSFKIEK